MRHQKIRKAASLLPSVRWWHKSRLVRIEADMGLGARHHALGRRICYMGRWKRANSQSDSHQAWLRKRRWKRLPSGSRSRCDPSCSTDPEARNCGRRCWLRRGSGSSSESPLDATADPRLWHGVWGPQSPLVNVRLEGPLQPPASGNPHTGLYSIGLARHRW